MKTTSKANVITALFIKKNKRIQNFPTEDERKTANPQERKAKMSGPLKRKISRKTISPSRRKLDHKAVQSTRQQGEHQHLTVRQGRERSTASAKEGGREYTSVDDEHGGGCPGGQQQKGEVGVVVGWGGGSTVHEGDGQDDRYRLRTGTKRKVDLRQYTEEDGYLQGGWVTRKTRIKPGGRGRGGRQRQQPPEGWTDSLASQPSSGRKDLAKKTKLSPKEDVVMM